MASAVRLWDAWSNCRTGFMGVSLWLWRDKMPEITIKTKKGNNEKKIGECNWYLEGRSPFLQVRQFRNCWLPCQPTSSPNLHLLLVRLQVIKLLTVLISSGCLLKAVSTISVWLYELEYSHSSTSLVLSAAGNKNPALKLRQSTQRQSISSPHLTAVRYAISEIPLLQVRCCHLSQQSHNSPCCRALTGSLQRMQLSSADIFSKTVNRTSDCSAAVVNVRVKILYTCNAFYTIVFGHWWQWLRKNNGMVSSLYHNNLLWYSQ